MWAAFKRREVREFIIRICAGYQATLHKLPGLYPGIECPTLILWGQQDKHFPPVHAQRLHAAIPGSRLEIIPGAEHWMAWYLAEEIAERIRDFESQPLPQ
jgi:pimeloyl-ACP methyl ester carboxylesterase